MTVELQKVLGAQSVDLDFCIWQTSRHIYSLRDLMEYFHTHDFVAAIRELYAYELEIRQKVSELGYGSERIKRDEAERALEVLRRVEKPFPIKEYEAVASAAARLYSFITTDCTFDDMYIRIVALRECMEDALGARKLVFVPQLRTEYCDKERLFGDEVFSAFADARFDIQDAGNCYALGLHTACVFHLMRALEAGLQVIARDLGVNWTPDPWGENLKHIKAAVEALSVKDQRKSYYSECCVQFDYVKNGWRNIVMHSTRTYDEHDAKAIFEHAHNLMKSLARKLSEIG